MLTTACGSTDTELGGEIYLMLQALRASAEDRCTDYDRGDYPYSQALEQQIVSRMGGLIYAPYTGTHFASTDDTEIEHMVALSEAHDSGMCAASASRRRELASELANLTLASPAVNREKSGRDVAEWTPPLNQCWFAASTIAVRHEYGLTVDQRERDALETILRGCDDLTMEVRR